MLSTTTAYFGQLEYHPSSVWHFPQGIPGFDEETDFVIIDQPSTRPLMFLQSLRTPALCFVALPVGAVVPDYQLEPSHDDLVTICLPPDAPPSLGRDVLCLALVTVDEKEGPTANLHSPLLINLRNRLGVQLIQPDTAYSLRHSVDLSREAAPCSC
jgi:flagellar assembly factor FliW